MIAIWGETQELADKTARELGIDFATSNMDEVLLHKDVGLLMILSQPVFHSQIAVKALGIGKHVYVHPPCSINPGETLRMVQAACYYPSLISVVGHGLRSLPAFIEMRRLIRDGYVGNRVSYCDVKLSTTSLIGSNANYSWKCSESMGGGVLNQYGAHVVDLLLFLTGEKAASIHGVIKTLETTTAKINGIRRITADDVAAISYETSTGCLVTINLNSQCNAFSQTVTVQGDHGSLVMRDGSLYGFKKSNGGKEEILHMNNNSTNTITTTKKLIEVDGDDGGGLPDLYVQGFVRMISNMKLLFAELKNDAVHNGGVNSANNDQESTNHHLKLLQSHNLSSFEEAFYVSNVLEAVHKSAREKCWTRVPEVS